MQVARKKYIKFQTLKYVLKSDNSPSHVYFHLSFYDNPKRFNIFASVKMIQNPFVIVWNIIYFQNWFILMLLLLVRYFFAPLKSHQKCLLGPWNDCRGKNTEKMTT